MELVYGSFETDYSENTFYILPTIGTSPFEDGHVLFIGVYFWFVGIKY